MNVFVGHGAEGDLPPLRWREWPFDWRVALSYLKGNGGNLCLQLRTSDEAGRAVAALEAASREIAEIRSAEEPDGPAAAYISEPLRRPDGPALTIDMADEPAGVLRQVADVIVAEAEAAGVTDGEVGPPKKATGHPFWGDQNGEVPGASYPQLLLRAQKFSGARPSIPSGPYRSAFRREQPNSS